MYMYYVCSECVKEKRDFTTFENFDEIQSSRRRNPF